MYRHPARMVAVPADELKKLLHAGDVFTVRRVYPVDTQPDNLSQWSREFLMQRIARHGAFYCGPLEGSDGKATSVGIPATDGGFFYIEAAQEQKDG